MRWSLRNLAEKDLSKMSDSLRARLELAEGMRVEDYRAALMKREGMRARFRRLAETADGFITLSSTGPAPLMADPNNTKGEPGITHTTGLPAYNAWTSAVGCPAVTVPLLTVDGMPVGVQLLGAHEADWKVAGMAAWAAAI